MSAIATHFQEMMPLEMQERIGATVDKPDDLRIVRLLSSHAEQHDTLTEVYGAMIRSGWKSDPTFNRVKAALGKLHATLPPKACSIDNPECESCQ